MLKEHIALVSTGLFDRPFMKLLKVIELQYDIIS